MQVASVLNGHAFKRENAAPECGKSFSGNARFKSGNKRRGRRLFYRNCFRVATLDGGRDALLACLVFIAATVSCGSFAVAGAQDGYAEDPHPAQGLESLMERYGAKPGGLFGRIESGTAWLHHRLVFNDVAYGTEIWLIDRTYNRSLHCRTASVWPAWNANATLLYHNRRRKIWDREDPYVHFSGGKSYRIIAGKRKMEMDYAWRSSPNQTSYGFTRCNRYYVVETPNGGVWVPYEPGDETMEIGPRYDGRPAKPNPDGTPHHPFKDADNYEVWLTAGGSTTIFHPIAPTREGRETGFGPLIRVRVAKLIDRESGEIENVIAPLSADPAYLRAYLAKDGRIEFPEWEGYRIMTADTVDELFEIYRYLPHTTHGHSSRSPCDEFEADDIRKQIFNIRAGKTHASFSASPDGRHYHLHWVKHPRFFVGWVRGWAFRTLARPTNANVVYQAFSDGTTQPVFDTKTGVNLYYGGGDFSMQSPDATKIHTATAMTGIFNHYVAVMARPRPPRHIAWEADGEAVSLSWDPPPLHREIRGYLVYRSERSGDGYTPLTAQTVDATGWRDESVEPGKAYYYVVTSLEHSGLESGYSEEAARAGIGLPEGMDDPLVVYAEAEAAVLGLPTGDMPGLAVGREAQTASDWYYVYRHPEFERGEASLSLRAPAGGRYHLWARIRSADSAPGRWTLGIGDEMLEVAGASDSWRWVRAGSVELAAGQAEVRLSTADAAAELDIICLASDGGFVPEGPRPENTRPPAPPAGLRAENARERVNRLTWEASDDPAVVFYNVYSSRAPFDKPSQKYRIGSPSDPEFIDWGLRAGERYHYAVTAVDRRRNESEPLFVEASTPPREFPEVKIELAFADADIDIDKGHRVKKGKFERSVAGGLRGSAFLVPLEKPNQVEWELDVLQEGTYYFWLRYLVRGVGSRGNQIRQDIEVYLDGERLGTLAGSLTDLNVPDELIAENHPMAGRVWTWARPDLRGLHLPFGRHTLRLLNLHPDVRYDTLVITDEPAYRPDDGRMQAN